MVIYFSGLINTGHRMLIALYDYNAREISDMSFRKGDRMELLDDRYAYLGNNSNYLTNCI